MSGKVEILRVYAEKQNEINPLHLFLYCDRKYTGMCLGREPCIVTNVFSPDGQALLILYCKDIFYYRRCYFQLSKSTFQSI